MDIKRSPTAALDFDHGFVVFINTSRDAFCTNEQVARELAIIEWIELWWLDEPEDGFGLGACLDSNDRDELFATGTADVKATATDLFEGGLRPAAIDNFRGEADLVGADGRAARYSFSWRSILPCQEPPGRPCEVARFALSGR